MWFVPLCKSTDLIQLFFFFLAIDINVYLLIVETNMSSDGSGLGCRILVPPNHVFVILSVDGDIVILPHLVYA